MNVDHPFNVDLKVYGLEVDRNWWQSSYAIAPFITNMRYLEEIDWSTFNSHRKGRFLQECCCSSQSEDDDWNFALMFCYFNDCKAFLHYLSLYGGSWLLLFGPAITSSSSPSAAIYTEPLPLQEDFQQLTEEAGAGQWLLHTKLSIGSNNVLALYRRTDDKQ